MRINSIKCTTEGVNLASHLSKLPRSTGEEVINGLRDEGQHEHQIRECQIHDQHISRGSQTWILSENAEHKSIPKNRNAAYK